MYNKEDTTTSTYFSDSNYEIERKKPMPSFNHAAIQTNISFLMKLHYKKKYRTLSEPSLLLSDWESVPDIAIYPWEKLDTNQDQIKISQVPLCVMEILSPTQSLNELYTKAKTYFKHQVKSCWIILPGINNIYIFSSSEEYAIFKKEETLHDEVMDIKFKVEEVFE